MGEGEGLEGARKSDQSGRGGKSKWRSGLLLRMRAHTLTMNRTRYTNTHTRTHTHTHTLSLSLSLSLLTSHSLTHTLTHSLTHTHTHTHTLPRAPMGTTRLHGSLSRTCTSEKSPRRTSCLCTLPPPPTRRTFCTSSMLSEQRSSARS